MTTTTSRPVDNDRFPRVRSLGTPYGTDAATLLTVLEQELASADAKDEVDRLQQVDCRAKELDFPALEQLAAPEQLVAALTERRQSQFRRWAGIRNVTAFLPLLLTWFFLAWAALAYQRQLMADPAKTDIPFLLLWEQRFGGAAIPSFSTTAVITCVLLVGVLAMTALAHRLEGRAINEESKVVARVDRAMNALRVAVEHGGVAAPASAEEWALAAQRILTDTQKILAESVQQTRDLIAANRQITENAKQTLESLRDDAQRFVAQLSEATLTALTHLREDNKQFIDRTARAAVDLLTKALEANRSLMADQMTPLVRDFRGTLDDFVRHHETYRDSARLLATSCGSMDGSARVLAESARSYTAIAKSIDDHLRVIENSQKDFVGRVTTSAESMRSTAEAMSDVSKMLADDVKKDLEQLAENVVKASADVASVNAGLVATSGALERVTTTLDSGVTKALKEVVGGLDAAAAELRTVRPPKWFWQR